MSPVRLQRGFCPSAIQVELFHVALRLLASLPAATAGNTTLSVTEANKDAAATLCSHQESGMNI